MSHHDKKKEAEEKVPAEEPEKAPEETAQAAPEEEKKAPDPVDALKAELEESKAKYLYLQAEYQNYRKRVSRDLADVRSNAEASTLSPFLTVFDYLSMADNAAMKSDNVESIRQGLKMIIGEFMKAFDEMGVKRLSAVGEKFDPNRHDAVANEFSDTVPEGNVIREWNCGFQLGERILRPARVVVSSGPEQVPEAPAGNKGEEEA